ncbi:MAG: Rrf2 family transcriptional regulator [Oscillospiraceae bacterium]|nr:Rrf2 family transcriptional regulator [Oscillospiraceae bacterium]
MHINLESDYAARIVHHLAHLPLGTCLSAAEIAQQTGLSPRFTLKILGKLAAAGLAASQKGVRGGYRLAKKPAEITLRAVIEAVEGPYRFSRCIGGDYDCCSPVAACPFYDVFDEITQMVTEKLDMVDFEQFIIHNERLP